MNWLYLRRRGGERGEEEEGGVGGEVEVVDEEEGGGGGRREEEDDLSVLLDEVPDGVQLQVVPRLLLQEQRDLGGEGSRTGNQKGEGGNGNGTNLHELIVKFNKVLRVLTIEDLGEKQETGNQKPRRKPETEILTCVPRLRVSPLGSSTTEKLLASDSQMYCKL